MINDLTEFEKLYILSLAHYTKIKISLSGEQTRIDQHYLEILDSVINKIRNTLEKKQ